MGRQDWQRGASNTGVITFLLAVANEADRRHIAAAAEENNPPLEQASWIAAIVGVLLMIIFYVLDKTLKRPRSSSDEEDRREVRAEETGRSEPAATPDRGTDIPPVKTIVPDTEMIDRDGEQAELRSRLLDGPGGIVVVSGGRGVGKSRLVAEVLADLESSQERQGQACPRIFRHEADPDLQVRLDVLIGDMGRLLDERPTAPDAFIGASSLDRLKAALEALGDVSMVSIIDHAENLLNPETGQLLDSELDAAFEFLTTAPQQHRVTVVLVTRLPPKAPAHRKWPAARPPITVRGLGREDFTEYLRTLDDVCGHGLTGALARHYDRLQGNPRLAEMAHAILESPEYDPIRLSRSLTGAGDVSRVLTGHLVRSLDPAGAHVLEALDAFGTSIDAGAVSTLLAEEHSENEVVDALTSLVSKRVVRETPDGRYYVPPSDSAWLLEGIAEADRPNAEKRTKLLIRAGIELADRHVRNPGGVEDLRFHFAELRAMMRTGMPTWAFRRLEDLDRELRRWNCGFLLLRQRETLRRQLGTTDRLMRNENALGHLYASDGDFSKASKAYGDALRCADDRQDLDNRARIRANLAGAYWWDNDVNSAYDSYARARDESEELMRSDPERCRDLLIVQMGTLEKMADCHRHWGRYDEAIQLAEEAFGVPEKPEYPDTAEARDHAARRIGITLKMARWRVELGETDTVEPLIMIAGREMNARNEDWLWASYLAGLAGYRLQRHHFDQAIDAAKQAVELALKYGDPITLPQARATLGAAYLMRDDIDLAEAARHIEGAARYRRQGGPLIVPALRALISLAAPEQVSESDDATTLFRQLLAETEKRIKRDRRDRRDITAWNYRGFALCGLNGKSDLDDARKAFETACVKTTPPAPNRVDPLVRLLERLDEYGGSPGRLQPVIQALPAAGTRPAEA
ncbi:tetratricopeptide repeat protein [Nonomuraea sp. NPDC049480]|uniref:tetratricopeptide repeat protein n=1 Tax=Nonomuraea sp. NPDC049480 TaxID=3364353 RepID=UPI0037B6BC8F